MEQTRMEETGSSLKEYLEILEPLIGDVRTGHTAYGIIEGIMAAGSLRMNQIALFSPSLSGGSGRV